MAPPKTKDERLFGAACLRVTIEKNPGQRAAGNEIYEAALEDLGLEDAEVAEYLVGNREKVETALAQARRRH